MKKLFTLVFGVLFALCANAQETTNLWTGEQTFDESWSGSVTVDKAKFAGVKEGDQIILTLAPIDPVGTWEWGSQVYAKSLRAGWSNIASTIQVDKAGEYTVVVKDEELTVTEKNEGEEPVTVQTTMLKELKEYGLAVQGIDAKLTSIDLVSSVATSSKELELVDGCKLKSTEFDKYADDCQVIVKIANTTEPYVSRNGWGIGEILTIDDYTKDDYTVYVKGQDGANFEFLMTIGDLKKIAKKGGTDYVVSEYNQTGVVFNMYNDCKVTNIIVKVPETDGISNAIAAPIATSAKTYNLAGQQVDASYKGVVIKGGKKFVQK